MVSRNEAAAIGFRIVQAGAWFLCARLILTLAGGDLYGAFSIILSLVIWLQMFDLGITSFLRTEMPRLRAEGKGNLIQACFRLGLLAIVLTCVAATTLLIAVAWLLPDAGSYALRRLQLDSLVDTPTLALLVAVIGAYALSQIAGNLCQAFLSASDRQYRYYAVASMGCLLQPMAVWLALRSGAGLGGILVAFCAPGVLAAAVAVAREWGGTARGTSGPIPPLVNRTSLSHLFIQLGGALASNLDLLLVSMYFGLTEAATYSVMKLIIQLPISVHAQFNLQSWALYARHIARHDLAAVRSLLWRNIRLTGGVSLLLLAGLGVAGPWFVQFWSSDALALSRGMALLFGVFGGLYMLMNALNVLMYAYGHTRSTFHLAWVAPPMFATLVWLLHGLGPVAVILSNVIVYGAGMAVGIVFAVYKLGRRTASVQHG